MDQITPELIVKLKKDIEFLRRFDNPSVASVADRVEILLAAYTEHQLREQFD